MAITINDVRFSYCNLFQAVSRSGKPEDAKFSTTILVPKSNTAAKAAIDAAIREAIAAGPGKCWNGQMPPMPAICVHDGDGPRPSDGQPFGEECRGMWVFTASAKQPPFVVDANVQNIINPNDVYSGMWGNVNVSFFPYLNTGKKGIGCGLNGVQKTRDDEPLSGRVTAGEAFAPAAAPQQSGYPTPGYTAPVPTAPAPAYPQQPAAPTYPTPAPGYGAPAYGAPGYPQQPAPYVDPITGQPYTPTGAPIMGL